LFVALYAIISALFTSITVFLPNYSSGNTKTNSIQPVWHLFASGLAFFVLGPGDPGKQMIACEQTRLRAFVLVGCVTKVSLD